MATLTPTLTLASTDLSSDELNFTVTKELTTGQDYRALARVKVLEPTIKDTPQERHRKFKSIFLSLPSEQKAIIEEAYKSERGASIHEVNMLDEVKGDYQAGIVKYIEMFGQEDKEFLNLKKIVERGF